MKWLCRNLYRKEKGFTLVELMIVIIILAVLTAIAIPSYMVLRDRARRAAAQSELKNIATAMEMYNADEDTYPDPGFADIIADLEGGGYMNPVPTADQWGNDYIYTYDGTDYTLESYGSDGADGGAGTAADIELVN